MLEILSKVFLLIKLLLLLFFILSRLIESLKVSMLGRIFILLTERVDCMTLVFSLNLVIIELILLKVTFLLRPVIYIVSS